MIRTLKSINCFNCLFQFNKNRINFQKLPKSSIKSSSTFIQSSNKPLFYFSSKRKGLEQNIKEQQNK
jgi:hypothetical protein